MALGSTQPLTEMSTRCISWGWRRPVRKADNLPPSCAVIIKSGNLNFLEHSVPLQACKGTALPLPLKYVKWRNSVFSLLILFFCATAPHWARAVSFARFLDHTQRRTTVSRNLLDEWSARHRDFYLTKKQCSQETDIHAPGGIQTQNLSRRAAVELRLRPRGHWDRLIDT
jgi:hypothetical protein